MKKIVSIVLALVLVLAIAAPAMAITGYVAPVTPTTAAVLPYGGSGISLVAAPQGNTLGILSLSSPATNKAYVANEVVFFRVDVSIPKAADIDMAAIDYAGASMTISSTAATLLDMEGYCVTAGNVAGNISGIVGIAGAAGSVVPVAEDASLNTKYNTLSIAMPGIVDTAREFIYIGTGIVKAQGSINVTIKGGQGEKFQNLEDVVLTAGWTYEVNDNYGKSLYDFKANGNDVIVVVYGTDGKTPVGEVSFVRDANDKCTAINVYSSKHGTFTFLKNQPISTGVVADCFGKYTSLSTGDDAKVYAELRAIYDSVMNFFGFDYDASGKLLDGHFTQKLNSFYAVDSVEVNLYTGAAITVPDPEVEIPQTGDAATTIGFVMVAMAIVAAAAVAYKKVRA